MSDLAERTADWLTLSEEDRARCTASDGMLDALAESPDFQAAGRYIIHWERVAGRGRRATYMGSSSG